MLNSPPQLDLRPTDRLHEAASILAKGLIRCRKQTLAGQNTAIGIRLEVPATRPLSVSPSTRGLRLRDDGDRP